MVFQSTFPRGERHGKGGKPAAKSAISIHVPARGTTREQTTLFDFHIDFNPRSREGNDLSGKINVPNFQYFNPRSREGNDMGKGCEICKRFDFNPRSREGNDIQSAHFRLGTLHFNPRSREGNDLPYFGLGFFFYHISIHVPARGTTGDRSGVPAVHHISIHVPARGTTNTKQDKRQYIPISIHVPARGTTTVYLAAAKNRCYFNPRSREGNDNAIDCYCCHWVISIHVPARGTTFDTARVEAKLSISIHVPARGTTGYAP